MALAEFVCGQCGHEFCPECVVFPYGTDKPPMCISCALQVAGVSKRPTGRPKLSRRAVKRRLKDSSRATQETTTVVAPEPEEEPDHNDERWMHGSGDADDFPGGWKQTF
jgi:hypothetical protein